MSDSTLVFYQIGKPFFQDRSTSMENKNKSDSKDKSVKRKIYQYKRMSGTLAFYPTGLKNCAFFLVCANSVYSIESNMIIVVNQIIVLTKKSQEMSTDSQNPNRIKNFITFTF